MPQVVCPVLVGRDEEARLLRAALEAAGAGRGSAVFLAGEAASASHGWSARSSARRANAA